METEICCFDELVTIWRRDIITINGETLVKMEKMSLNEIVSTY